MSADGAPVARPRTLGPDRNLYLVLAGALVLVIALFPLARWVDNGLDEQRPLYDDIAEVAWLEYLVYQQTGRAVAAEVSGGEEVTIGEETFEVSPGVVIVATPREGGWCIEGHDDLGNESGRFCYDGDEDPGKP